MIFPLSSFCFYFYLTAWMCNIHCSLLISRLIFVFCQQNERSATDQTPGRPPRCLVFMDLVIWMSVSILPQRKQAELQTSSPGHHWSPPGNQQRSPKCLRSAKTFFFPQWNKPQTFFGFCKTKICTKGSDLNENLIGFGWLGCFPKVQEKHIWCLEYFPFCFREGVFL